MNFLIIWYGNEIPEYYNFDESDFSPEIFKEIHGYCNDAGHRDFGPESGRRAELALWRIKAMITNPKDDKWFPKHARKYLGMLVPYFVIPTLFGRNITAVFAMGRNFYKDPDRIIDESAPDYDE